MIKSRFMKRLILAFLILSLLSSSFVFQLFRFKAHRGLSVLRTINETTIGEVGGEKRQMWIEITPSTFFYLFANDIHLSFMISDNAHPEAHIDGFFRPYASIDPDSPYCNVRESGKGYDLVLSLGNADTGCKEKEIIEPYAKDFISKFRSMPNSLSPIEQFHLFGGVFMETAFTLFIFSWSANAWGGAIYRNFTYDYFLWSANHNNMLCNPDSPSSYCINSFFSFNSIFHRMAPFSYLSHHRLLLFL